MKWQGLIQLMIVLGMVLISGCQGTSPDEQQLTAQTTDNAYDPTIEASETPIAESPYEETLDPYGESTEDPYALSTDDPYYSSTEAPYFDSTEEPYEYPTEIPDLGPWGTAERPIAMGMIYEDQVVQEPRAAEFVQYLADQTGLVFQVVPYTDSSELLTAMQQGLVAFAWMQPLTYLYAYQNNIATVQLITRNFGVSAYGTQILVRSDSGFTTYYDPKTNSSRTFSGTAMLQLAGNRPCFIDESSLAGYIVPMGLLKQSNIEFKEPVIIRTNASLIRALYAGGICDFGATFAISGDPRTSTSIQNDLPDVMKKVVILWRSEAIIPTMNVSISNLVDLELSNKITEAILLFSATSQGPLILSEMTTYQIEALEPISVDAYYELESLVNMSGVDLSLYLGN